MRKTTVRAALNRPAKEPVPDDWTGLLRLLDKSLKQASADFKRESGQ